MIAVYTPAACADGSTPVRFGFDYQVEPELGCPSEEELRAALTSRLEYDPFSEGRGATEQAVRVAVARAGAGLEARIDWVDRSGQSEGERRLATANADCAELVRGVVFAVAVQIQLRASTASREPAQAPPPPRALPSERRPPRPRRVATSKPWEFLAGVGAGLEHGWSPGTALSFDAVAAVSRGRAWLEAGVGGSTPTRQDAPDGTGFEARAVRAWLAPCVRTPPFGWCATGMVGKIHVRGYGVDHPLSPGALLAAAGGRVELLWPVSRPAAVLVHAQALATITPQTVTLNEVARWSTAPFYVGVGIDLALIFR